MTSLLRPPPDRSEDRRHRRSPVLAATLAGAAAAGAVLVVCLAAGVIGWFAADAGAHGTTRDGLRVGALAWLMAHGSGVHVDGAPVTVVPLGLTLLCGWAAWRFGLRAGDAVSGLGPDADRIADGERDWTVPVGAGLFTIGYLLVVVVTGVLAASQATSPSLGRAIAWAVVLATLVGGAGLAVGSGRAAVWLPLLPAPVRLAVRAAAVILLAHLALAAILVLVAVVLDLGDAANVLSRLQAGVGGALTLTVVTLVVLPNLLLWTVAWVLGPGFTVGTDTLVSPGLVSIGELPLFPLFSALPPSGHGTWWTLAMQAAPFLLAAVVVALVQRRVPTPRWYRGAVQGCGAGLLAGLVIGLLAALSGGAVGPGRMSDFGPLAVEALVQGLAAFGIGGLLGGLVMTAWQRRSGDVA